jgi:hypothetical protein
MGLMTKLGSALYAALDHFFPTTSRVKWIGFGLMAIFVFWSLLVAEGSYQLFQKTFGKVLFGFTALGWIYRDSTERGLQFNNAYKATATLFPEIALPYWLIKTRGWKVATISVLKMCGLVILALLLVVVMFGLVGVKFPK